MSTITEVRFRHACRSDVRMPFPVRRAAVAARRGPVASRWRGHEVPRAPAVRARATQEDAVPSRRAGSGARVESLAPFRPCPLRFGSWRGSGRVSSGGLLSPSTTALFRSKDGPERNSKPSSKSSERRLGPKAGPNGSSSPPSTSSTRSLAAKGDSSAPTPSRTSKRPNAAFAPTPADAWPTPATVTSQQQCGTSPTRAESDKRLNEELAREFSELVPGAGSPGGDRRRRSRRAGRGPVRGRFRRPRGRADSSPRPIGRASGRDRV